MSKKQEKLEYQKAEKKMRIAEAAMELFAEMGFHNASVSQLAKKARVAKGLVYNYFDSKDAILKHIVFSFLERIHHDLDPDHNGVLEHREFINYIDKTFASLQKNPAFWKLYFSIITQPEVLKIVEEEMRIFSAPLMNMLYVYFKERGYDDPEEEMAFFGALMSGVCSKYVYAPDLYPVEKMKRRIKSLYIEKS